MQEARAHQDFGRAVAFSADGKLVATGTDVILLWDTATKKIVSRFDEISSVWSLAFSPDGKTIASADKDEIVVWDANSRKKITTIGPQAVPVYSLAFSRDGNRLFAAKRDRAVRVYTHHLMRWGQRLD